MKRSVFAGFGFSAFHALQVYSTQDAFTRMEIGPVHHSAYRTLSEESTHFEALSILPDEYRNELLSLSQSLQVFKIGETQFCSERLATLLQRCTKDRLATEDRDEAAMLFTLCDRGRDYPPPMECEDLRRGGGVADKMVTKRCAMALDQHQNFQRAFDVYRILVIPEKCNSLNAIFNVDPSRDVYKRVTHELANFLHAFSRRQEKNDEYFSQWDDRLNAFRDATADLSTARHSLMDFNERFVEDVSGLLQFMNTTFDGLTSEALKANRESAVELRNEMSRIRDEHETSLVSTVASFEYSIAEGLNGIFNEAQERQSGLSSAAELMVKQLIAVVEELAMARQDFQALGIFVKDITSKAYSQAFLLDKKQHEVSESLSELGAEIRGLANTTQQLNDSLAGIREETLDSFSMNDQYSGASWLNAIRFLRSILGFLGLSPFWALSVLALALPRFVVEQAAKLALWFSAVMISFLARTLLGHRKYSSRNDEERNAQDRQPFQLIDAPQSLPLRSSSHIIPQVTYTANDKIPCRDVPPLYTTESIGQFDKLLSDWTNLRSRVRPSGVSGASRIPARLYANEPEIFGNAATPDLFSRTRTRSLL